MDAATGLSQTQAILNSFQVLSLLQMTDYMWPRPPPVEDAAIHDFIIIGGGTAGSIIANGLTKDENVKVLVIEAGDAPQLNSALPAMFPFLPHTSQDWNLISQNDGYTAQYQRNGVCELTQGKMLGGSSSLDHLLYVRGNPDDYDYWAAAANDPSWKHDGMYKYFIQNENVEDPEILNSTYKQFHGTNGYLKLTRGPYEEMIPYMKSFEEMGYKTVLDINGNDTLGFAQNLLTLSDFRQSSAYSFLMPIKDRSNLYVLQNTVVNEIIFDGDVAVGVKATDKNNKEITFRASREVIVTAGAFNTPKLLMLSGIGPKKHLESLGIKVRSDLPVGQNLQDHAAVSIWYKMEESSAPAPIFNPFKFPGACFMGHVSLDKASSVPEYQAIGLVLPHDTTTLLPLCQNVFNYNDFICQTLFDSNKGRNLLWVFLSNLHPKSRGQVLLKSTDPRDDPLVYTGAYSVEDDIIREISYLGDFNRILDTSYFKNASSELVDLKIPECQNFKVGSEEYWRCYTIAMSATLYHYCGTCSLGSVVDARLRVFNIKNLRVADASAIPRITSGKIREPVNALAAKAVDMIKEDNNLA